MEHRGDRKGKIIRRGWCSRYFLRILAHTPHKFYSAKDSDESRGRVMAKYPRQGTRKGLEITLL